MKRIAVTLGALAAAVAIYALVQLQAAGQFRSVEVLHPGTCRTVEGVAGPEDIELHPNQAYALISSYDRRSASEGRPRPGALFRLALTHEAEPVNLTPGAGLDFRPHGISMYADPDGRTTLFVVNHPRWRRFGPPSGDATGPRHTIEVYDLTGTGLVHRRTLADPLLVSPNDLVALDHHRFYVTNDHGTEPGLLRRLEDYLRLPWADVLYYDGAAFQRVADGLSYANGIQLSADGERLYVSEVTRSRVREYRREPETGRLAELRRVDVGFGADNINLEPATGALWVAGHVKLLTFARHAGDAGVAAPSEVKRLFFEPDRVRQETRFLDDGALLSGASAAAFGGDTLLIGAVFSPHALLCTGVE